MRVQIVHSIDYDDDDTSCHQYWKQWGSNDNGEVVQCMHCAIHNLEFTARHRFQHCQKFSYDTLSGSVFKMFVATQVCSLLWFEAMQIVFRKTFKPLEREKFPRTPVRQVFLQWWAAMWLCLYHLYSSESPDVFTHLDQGELQHGEAFWMFRLSLSDT